MAKTDKRHDISADKIMFDCGEPMDVSAVGAAHAPWWNRTPCAVNDTWVRL
jgi:hypothetical protein